MQAIIKINNNNGGIIYKYNFDFIINFKNSFIYRESNGCYLPKIKREKT